MREIKEKQEKKRKLFEDILSKEVCAPPPKKEKKPKDGELLYLSVLNMFIY